MKEPTQANLLFDESESTSNKTGKSGASSCGYSTWFTRIVGIIGVLCLIAAIALTISGSIGLRDYGFANGTLIAGIVLFGVGAVLTIGICLSACLK